MSNPWLHGGVLLVGLMMSAVSAAGPAGQSHPCASVVDPADRLVCYDKTFPPAAGTLSGAEALRQKALRDFGLHKTPARPDEPERMRDTAPDAIEGTIANLSRRSTGERVITLDNGQIWLLTEVTSKGRLKNGDRVVIRKAALGSHMLLTPARVALRARRIQ